MIDNVSMLTEGVSASITDGLSTVTEVVGGVYDLVISNPLCLFFVGVSLLGCGIGLFRKLMH